MKRFLITIMLGAVILTGCASDKNDSGLKTGPTVTPIPPKATEEEASLKFDFTQEEIDNTIDSALDAFKLRDVEFAFDVTEEMTTELSKHNDGYSEVYVYDESDLMIAVLMYDETKHLYRAELTEYKNGIVTGGTTYEEGILSSLYITAEENGSFRIEVKRISEGFEALYVDESGACSVKYDADFKKID